MARTTDMDNGVEEVEDVVSSVSLTTGDNDTIDGNQHQVLIGKASDQDGGKTQVQYTGIGSQHQFLSSKASDQGGGKTQVQHTGVGSQMINTGTGRQFNHVGTGNQIVAENIHFHTESLSLFSYMAEKDATANEAEMGFLEIKNQFLTGRRPPRLLEHPCRYSPYTEVKNAALKSILVQICQRFVFLDRCFAEFFRVAVPSFASEDRIKKMLQEAREALAQSQHRNPSQASQSNSIYLGDLGFFCEEVAQTWGQENQAPGDTFTVRHKNNQERLAYLQYALEVPYWKFMLSLFDSKRIKHMDLISGEIASRTLWSVTREVLVKKQQLLEKLGELEGDEKEDIQPIISGIDARLEALEVMEFDMKPSHEFLTSPEALAPRDLPTSKTEQLAGRPQGDIGTQSNETAILMGLVLIFIIGAIVPGYKAFSISMQSSSPGSTSDADFWYLVQSGIMAVMGNIVMVVPLLRKFWFSPAYGLMWAFFLLGLVFAAISIIIYPFFNTGWSSMIAFFGSVASAASVLVMTQATAKGVNSAHKVKRD